MRAWKPVSTMFRQYKTASSSTIFNSPSMVTPTSQTRVEKITAFDVRSMYTLNLLQSAAMAM
jgi:hypothetical protein